MFDLLNIAKALSDANRVRILMALRHAPLCVCQITAFLDLAPSTTSKHLSILRQARLIESIKQGRWVYYQLASQSQSPAPSPSVLTALEWVRTCLQDDHSIQEDTARIAAILAAAAAGLDDGTGDNSCVSSSTRAFCHSPELHLLDQTQNLDTSSEIMKEHNHD